MKRIANDLDKTAAVAYTRLCEYNKMPIGMKNALATFRRAAGVKLATVKCRLALPYADNIIILLETLKEYLQHNEKTVTPPNETKVKMKMKIHFFSWKMVHLGHAIDLDN